MNKSKAIIKHAKRRALEREGLVIGKNTLDKLVQQIKNGQAKFIRKQSQRVSEWLVIFNGKPRRVIYDRKRELIVTFLPPEQSTFSPRLQ